MIDIRYGDNLELLKQIESESIDLIYIDPPFNTGKTQRRTSIKTVQAEEGTRIGFQGLVHNLAGKFSRLADVAFSIDSHSTQNLGGSELLAHPVDDVCGKKRRNFLFHLLQISPKNRNFWI